MTKVLLKSTLATWEYFFTTNCALCRMVLLDASLLLRNIYLYHTLLRSFRRLVNFPRTVGHEWVVFLLHCSLPLALIYGLQYFAQIQMIIIKCHIGPFFAVLGENMIILPFSRRAPLPLRKSSIFANFLNMVVIHCKYFDCFFICNQMISHLCLVVLTIRT